MAMAVHGHHSRVRDHCGGAVTIQLRPYQQEAIQSIYDWFGANTTNPLLVLPTGTGKSVVIAGFIEGVLRHYPTQRILVVTHVKELVEQNAAKMLAIWPAAPVGVYSAGLGRRDTEASITFAGIQSIYNRAGELGWFDLVLIDEAHLLPRSGEGRYRTYLKALLSMNPAAKVIGFTATPYRTDTGSLTHGDGSLFSGIAYEADVVSMIKAGYLSPLVPKRVDGEIDTAGVKKQAGDFNQAQLEQVALAGTLVEQAVSEILTWGQDRRSWLVFACGVEHGREVERVLRNRGVEVASVFGDTPNEQRDEITRRYRSGDLRCLVNCAVLTTGFDAPATDLIAMMRPTMSAGLYVQMAGRGMRIADGKTNCLVLDFGGNVDRHGPIDLIKPKDKSPGGGADFVVPMKTCPRCKTIVVAMVRECGECGYEFPYTATPQHNAKASTKTLIAGLGDDKYSLEVLETYYSRHVKSSDPTRVSMQVEYVVGVHGTRTVREWISFEARGYPRQVAEGWWLRRAPGPVPATVAEAIERRGQMRRVASLKVESNGKYPKILGYQFAAAAAHQEGQGRVPGAVAQGARCDPG